MLNSLENTLPSPIRVSAEAPSVEPLIEDYLDHVCAPLVGRVPYARRQTLRCELAEHLDALIEAREELGESREKALERALKQFGDPSVLARQWLQEWDQAHLTPETLWEAARRGMRCYAPAGVLSLALLLLMWQRPGPIGVPLVGVILPAIAGFRTGFHSRRWAMAAGCAGAAAVTGIAALVAQVPFAPAEESVFAALAMLGLLFWVPVSCVTSELGAWARRRTLRRPQPWRAQRA